MGIPDSPLANHEIRVIPYRAGLGPRCVLSRPILTVGCNASEGEMMRASRTVVAQPMSLAGSLGRTINVLWHDRLILSGSRKRKREDRMGHEALKAIRENPPTRPQRPGRPGQPVPHETT